MKQKIFNLGILGLLSMGAGVAQASPSLLQEKLSHEEPSDKSKKDAEKALKQARADLEEGRVERVARLGLEHIVRAAINVLKVEGYTEYAARKESEWNASFSLMSNPLGMLDLGDHAPLSEWVADFYVGLEARIDARWLKLFNLYDIKTFNYGIPVAVHPAGNPQGVAWGSDEYKLHFVPVAAASAHWIFNGACSLTVPLPFSLGCGVAALLPRYGMQYWVAPRLSDRIYDQFNN
jgi:hypothetical protein